MIDECDRCREDLPRYLYGDLPPPQLDAVSAHLSTCSNCAVEAEQFRAGKERVREWSRPEAPAAFWQEYRRGLRRRLPKVRKCSAWNARWVPRSAFLFALALLVLGAVVWMPFRPQEPQSLSLPAEHPGMVETLALARNLGMFENLSLLEEMDSLEEPGQEPAGFLE